MVFLFDRSHTGLILTFVVCLRCLVQISGVRVLYLVRIVGLRCHSVCCDFCMLLDIN